ncbi:MAG: hypothetical protein AAF628_15990 [Planctomycetota bacterium]
MTERSKFVAAVESGRESMTALCAQFGISRKTHGQGQCARPDPAALLWVAQVAGR